MENTAKDSIKSRRVAVLAANGVDESALQAVKKALEEKGAQGKLISKTLGTIKGSGGQQVPVDMNAVTTSSIMFDAVFIPGGQQSVEQLKTQGDALHFIAKAYVHNKTIAATDAGIELLRSAGVPDQVLSNAVTNGGAGSSYGVVTAGNTSDLEPFIEQLASAIAQHRHWMRPQQERVMA